MTLSEIIINCESYNELSIVYAKKQNNKFNLNSEVVVLELNEDEMQANTADIAKQKYPGYEYFLEVLLIHEMYQDLKTMDEFKSIEKLVERIIYYAEYDA